MLKIISMFEQRQSEYLAALGMSRRLKRYLGTTTVDGVEVFNPKIMVYPTAHRETESTKKLLKFIGMYDSFKSQDYSGIAEMWIYLNPNKMSNVLQEYMTKELLIDMIYEDMELDVAHEIAVEIQLNTKELKEATAKLTGIELYNYCKKNYVNMYSTGRVIADSMTLTRIEGIGELALFDISDDFKVEYMDYLKYTNTVTRTVSDPYGDSPSTTTYTDYVPTIKFLLKVTRIASINPTTSKLMTLLYDGSHDATLHKLRTGFDMVWDPDYNDYVIGATAVTDETWYKGMLRVSAYDGIPTRKRAEILLSIIDYGYKKEKVPWWKKALAIVIVVVAIALAVHTGGYSLTWGSIALAATYTAVAMMVIAVYAAKNGQQGIAEYAAARGQVAGKVALVAGAMTGLQGLIKVAIALAIKEVAKEHEDLQIIAAIALVAYGIDSGAYLDMSNNLASLWTQSKQNEIKEIQAETAETQQKTNELLQEQLLLDDADYVNKIDPLNRYVSLLEPLSVIDNSYYTEAKYQPTRYNIQAAGPFKGVGVFSAGYKLS